MQLGITIPLQKYLKLSKPLYGEPEDLFFCWQLHWIIHQNKKLLIAVNANNRYTVIMAGMTVPDWKQITEVVIQGIERAMSTDGYSKNQIDSYFNLAGEAVLTKTHGRKPVAGLNKAIDSLVWRPDKLDESQMYQKKHGDMVNRDIYSPAGFSDYGLPVEFFREDMKRVGIKI